VLEYAGREDLLTRRTIALLLVEPVVVNGLVWTGGHDLFIECVAADAPAAAGARLGGFAAGHRQSSALTSAPSFPAVTRGHHGTRAPREFRSFSPRFSD